MTRNWQLCENCRNAKVGDELCTSCAEKQRKDFVAYCTNPDPRCTYPRHPEGDKIDYCWSYALHLDGDPKWADMEPHCRGCDFFRPDAAEAENSTDRGHRA